MQQLIKKSPVERSHLVCAYNGEHTGYWSYVPPTEIIEMAGWTCTTRNYVCVSGGTECKPDSEKSETICVPNDIEVGDPVW